MTVNNIQNGRNDTNSIINLNYSFFGNMDTVVLKCSNTENQFKNHNTNKCHDKDLLHERRNRYFRKFVVYDEKELEQESLDTEEVAEELDEIYVVEKVAEIRKKIWYLFSCNFKYDYFV